MKDLIKPIQPKSPDVFDKKKYPNPPTNEGKNYLGDPIYLPNQNYIRDAKKYLKDMEKFIVDIEKYEQCKFIKIIKNTQNIENLIKKYKINLKTPSNTKENDEFIKRLKTRKY